MSHTVPCIRGRQMASAQIESEKEKQQAVSQSVRLSSLLISSPLCLYILTQLPNHASFPAAKSPPFLRPSLPGNGYVSTLRFPELADVRFSYRDKPLFCTYQPFDTWLCDTRTVCMSACVCLTPCVAWSRAHVRRKHGKRRELT